METAETKRLEKRWGKVKKTVLFAAAALLSGFALGVFFGSGALSGGESPLLTAQAASLAAPVPAEGTLESPLAAAPEPLDPMDNTRLSERAGLALEAMKAQDYGALSAMVSPRSGVVFTPYSTVDLECDLCLSARQVAELGDDDTVYVWGVEDGSGETIKLTGRDYFARYVFNADYTQAPYLSIDEVAASGNAMENVAESYPEGRFVEYYFPGLDPKMEGYDWCSLKLVFEVYQNDWYLVGLIHGQWTI